MKILVTEFITGGGLLGLPLPASLAAEGRMMLTAIVRDLSDYEGVDVHVTLEPRFANLILPTGVEYHLVEQEYVRLLADLSRQFDLVLPVAPESDDQLEIISTILHQRPSSALISPSNIIALCASKTMCTAYLHQHGIPVVPSYKLNDALQITEGRFQQDGWIVKPDHGEGSEGVFYYKQLPDARTFEQKNGLLLQPYLVGNAASLSLLCDNGECLVLGFNQQRMNITNGNVSYAGSQINGLLQFRAVLTELANQIVSVLPQLCGYVGVDLIIQNGKPIVLEINPRITTSYVGLRASLGENPAVIMLDWFQHKYTALKNKNRIITEVDLTQ